ncbi:hypothetical protein [Bradyrhizobium sp. S3.5.5]
MKRGRFTEEQIIGILKEHEAGEYIATLPKKEHAAPEWSTTTAALPPA